MFLSACASDPDYGSSVLYPLPSEEAVIPSPHGQIKLGWSSVIPRAEATERALAVVSRVHALACSDQQRCDLTPYRFDLSFDARFPGECRGVMLGPQGMLAAVNSADGHVAYVAFVCGRDGEPVIELMD